LHPLRSHRSRRAIVNSQALVGEDGLDKKYAGLHFQGLEEIGQLRGEPKTFVAELVATPQPALVFLQQQ